MAQGLARFVFDFAIPLLLIRLFASAQIPEEIPVTLWVSFYLPLAITYGLGIWTAKKFFARDPMGQVITGFGCAFGNTILLGLPLVLLAYGEAGAVPFFLLISIHGLTLFTVTTLMLEIGRSQNSTLSQVPMQIVRGLIKNPIILGLVTGLALNLTGTSLPGPIDKVAEYMQQAVTPCALFSLGVTLSRYGFAGRLEQSLFVTVMKTVVFPVGVWLLASYVFELPRLWTAVAVLTAAQPVGVNVYLFAQRYGTATALVTSTVFLSTVTSVATLSFLLYVFP